MKNILCTSNFGFTKLCVALALMLALNATTGWGQISIPNTSAVTQNFDSMSATTTASLPSGWKATAAAAGAGTTAGWSTAANVTATTQQASSGSPTTGAIYNWGSSASERSLGFMTSGSYASPNSVMAFYQNNTGGTISALAVSFDIERYRINSAAASVTFLTSTDGTTWTAATAGDSGAFATGASSYTFTGGTVVSKSFNLTGLSIANGSSIYFKWNFSTTGSNSQGLGLDNVSVTATTSGGSPAAPGAPTITGITPGNGSLSVAFTPPASDGGFETTNYKYSTDAGITWTAVSPAATTSPILISGLNNGTTYDVQIRAVNAVGDGTPTASTPGTPSTPPIWTNPITGTNPNTSSPYTTGDVKNSNVAVSGIARGSGINGTGANDRYNANGWNIASLDTTKYFEFTITPNSGYQVSLASFVYTGQASGTGPNSFALRSSADAYATDIGSVTVSGTTISLSASKYQNLSQAITFRLYAWGASAPAGTFSVNDFSFNGTVEVVSSSPPTITSPNAFSGTVGVAFSNTITATGSDPIAFSGTDLPGGLSVATNGVISGTPTAAGIFTNAVLTATNAAGTNNQAATFTIAKGTPVITAVPTALTINEGQALSASVLSGGTADVAGSFAWTAPSTFPAAGTMTFGVTFSPTDTANYNPAITTVSLTVNPAPAGTTYNSWLNGVTPSDANAAMLDYAFGAVTPGTLDPRLKPTVAVTGGNLVLTYYVRQGTVGLTVTPKTSADLAVASGDWVEVIPVDVDVDRDVNGIFVQQKTASVPASGDRKFLKLEVLQE